jgi:hypothetical protein
LALLDKKLPLFSNNGKCPPIWARTQVVIVFYGRQDVSLFATSKIEYLEDGSKRVGSSEMENLGTAGNCCLTFSLK